MNERFSGIADDGLHFFGRIVASLSHEIRNVLATIYETSGLMEDLVLMAERGRPLQMERIKDLASRAKSQVRRGREIAENMSRFAHSVDESMTSVNLDEMLTLVICLGQRIASMRRVTLQVDHPGNPVMVRTDPFVLETLLWLCLEFAIQSNELERTVILVPEAGEKGALIRLKGIHELHGDAFPVRKLEPLTSALGVEVILHREAGEIVLHIPPQTGGE